MKKIAVSQRVDITSSAERRDALDQRWDTFFLESQLIPILIPNNVALATNLLLDIELDGIVLTGGNDLAVYGGDSPERDKTEKFLLNWAIEKHLPLLGVCRGMQFIQHYFGVPLKQVDGHVQEKLGVVINNTRREVNSFHHWATKMTIPDLRVWAKSDDNIVKAIAHVLLPIQGIMWHPERLSPFSKSDVVFFYEHFHRQNH